MTVLPLHAVVLTAEDAGYLAEVLEHLCATRRPSARLAHLTARMRRSCDALAVTQAKHLRDVTAGPAPAHDAQRVEELDVAEAARRLACTEANVRDLIARGRLSGRRVGGRWLLPGPAVAAYASRRAARRSG